MIGEEYRGYNLTAVRHGGMWQVSIYPLSVGQIVPKPRGASGSGRRNLDVILWRSYTGEKGPPLLDGTADDQAAPPPVAA